jgi:NAD(P)-dependent dehydrogenase (short-subunit alcohol dehydrogenase family)
MHAWAKLDWENCNAEKNFDASNAYSQSKLLNVIFSNELHIRLINNNICTYALHPGVIATKLLRAGWSGGASVESGAETSVYLATKEWNKEESGLYWDNNRIVTCSAEGRKSENGQFLFDMAEKHSSIKWPL